MDIHFDQFQIEVMTHSRLLPGLDIALLEPCLAFRSWQQARRTVRAGLART